MVALTVCNLQVDINGKRIVNDISLTINSGDIYCLLGPNGAGKTTALRGIVGAMPIQGGTVQIGPYNMASHPTKAKQQIGYIPDDGWLFRNVTGQQYLAFIAKLRRLPDSQWKATVAELSDKFNLHEAMGQPIDELSRGTQQKIAMIAGLMHRPQLVVMDEPLTALDPLVTREAINLIQELRHEGVTFLIATHLLNFAETVATHIGLLAKGHMVYQGSIQEVKKHYAHHSLDGILANAMADI